MTSSSLAAQQTQSLNPTKTVRIAWVRWSVVAFFVGLVFIPHLLFPSLARVDRSLIRAGVMLAEVGVVLVWSLTRQRPVYANPIRRGSWIVGGLWAASVLIATASADHVAPAVMRSAEWLSHGLFATVLWLEFQRDPKLLAAAVRAIPLGFTALVIAMISLAAQHPDPAGYDWAGDVPYLGNVRRLGMYAVAGVAFSSPALLTPKVPRRAQAWAWVGHALSWGVLLWCGGRGSIVAGVVVAGCVWMLAGQHRLRVAQAMASAVCVGAVLSLCLPVESSSMGLWRFFLRMEGVTEVDAFSSGRSMLWRASLAAWKPHPWFGLGPDAATFVLAPFRHVQPHNFVVQFLVEWGLVGTAAFVVLLGGVLVTAARRATTDTDAALRANRVVAASYLVGMTALALLDGAFYHARPLALIAGAVAIAVLPATGGETRRRTLRSGVRSGIWGLALGVGLLVCAHVTVVRAVWDPVVPEPISARATLVRAFPSTASLRETATWAKAWAPRDPEAAREWARWGSRHAVFPWYYLRLEADLLLRRGEVEAAEALYAEALRLEAAALPFR